MDARKELKGTFGSLAVNITLAVLGMQAFSGAALHAQGADSVLTRKAAQHELATARTRAVPAHGASGDLLSVRV